MPELTETYFENKGESIFSMEIFLNTLAEQGRINIFDTTGIKQERVSDSYPSTYIIIDTQTKIKYLLGFRSHGGDFCDDGESQTIFEKTFLHRLPKNFSMRKARFETDGSGYPYLPGLHPDARLLITKDDDFVSMGDHDGIKNSSRRTELMGEQDSLIDRVIEFVTS